MQIHHDEQQIVADAIKQIDDTSKTPTDGKWLEKMTAEVLPLIKRLDVAECWLWDDWPALKDYPELAVLKGSNHFDCIAQRGSDEKWIAIECKSRVLNQHGRGEDIGQEEVGKFTSTVDSDIFAEMWLVTNGDFSITTNAAQRQAAGGNRLHPVNLRANLAIQRSAYPPLEDAGSIQSKTAMQTEVVNTCVDLLQKQLPHDTENIPKGEARGKIILPCGTGKTRISLKIIEHFTHAGAVSIVLCPSIALVAQIRDEYLHHCHHPIRSLVVCSDKSAGYDPKREGQSLRDDPTLDNSLMSAANVHGKVTTHPDEIGTWIKEGQGGSKVSVIFGTYQSGHKISKALLNTATIATVLIADEAHRTAGIRKKNSRNGSTDEDVAFSKKIRKFTLCHDREAFPAQYRIYQTATPKIYDEANKKRAAKRGWIVRDMDHEGTFGPELYRMSFVEAVQNNWLADYRIIALAVNSRNAIETASSLARDAPSRGKGKLSTPDYIRGLAFTLAISGVVNTSVDGFGTVDIKSCIAFLNTVAKSKKMSHDLQKDVVQNWLASYASENSLPPPPHFSLSHVDATDPVSRRDAIKQKLSESTLDTPHAVLNVGIFGEGTDSPDLSAVAFLEPRKSPIEVVQAVGRCMRSTAGKSIGYIICPIEIPPNEDPEEFLSHSPPDGGWQVLGQVLRALRAHDERRIEEELPRLLGIYMPPRPEKLSALVAIADSDPQTIVYGTVTAPYNEILSKVEESLQGESFQGADIVIDPSDEEIINANPSIIFSGKRHGDHPEVRTDSTVRDSPRGAEIAGNVNVDKSKKQAREMINSAAGRKAARRKPGASGTNGQSPPTQLTILEQVRDEYGATIAMNLLENSGLARSRIERDSNLLESAVMKAAQYLREDGLAEVLKKHYIVHVSQQSDGCVIAALMMMTAAMLHQRVHTHKSISDLRDIIGLQELKADPDVVAKIQIAWRTIRSHDFQPIILPALRCVDKICGTQKTVGLERALHHICKEVEQISGLYDEIGADHAGMLYNRVMGNQKSDGAFFTRSPIAALAAALTLDVLGDDLDWADEEVWRTHKVLDLACGTGTLLRAMLTEMLRRGRDAGSTERQLGELQKIGIEDTIKGLDVNEISLQFAASQLTTGHGGVNYRRMGLHLMPYGEISKGCVHIGSLEMLRQSRMLPQTSGLYPDEEDGSRAIWGNSVSDEVNDTIGEVKGARIVIMNPPFTNRIRAGEKFDTEIQKKLRAGMDYVRDRLIDHVPGLTEDSLDKNSIQPMFTALADLCIPEDKGVLSMIVPTIALTAPSGETERRFIASRYHVHTIVTSHAHKNRNMAGPSDKSEENHSLVICERMEHPHTCPTRFIQLDKMPLEESQATTLHGYLDGCSPYVIPEGWGEVFEWTCERIKDGDWSQAIWRSNELAVGASEMSKRDGLHTFAEMGLTVHATGRTLRGNQFSLIEKSTDGHLNAMISAGGMEGEGRNPHLSICSQPDGAVLYTGKGAGRYSALRDKASHLFITAAQSNSSARMTSITCVEKCVGNYWFPVTGCTLDEAYALSVFLNSTAGRLQIMRSPSKMLTLPTYSADIVQSIGIPNFKDDKVLTTLINCFHKTKYETVPLYRDGECDVRRLWDEAVAEALGWYSEHLSKLRHLLHREPHVRGLSYGQYK